MQQRHKNIKNKANSKEIEKYLDETKIEKNVDFIKPNLITLGWGCNVEEDNIKRLIQYAERNNIKLEKLSSDINYETGCYYTRN